MQKTTTQPPPIIVVFGDEEFQKSQALARLLDALLPAGVDRALALSEYEGTKREEQGGPTLAAVMDESVACVMLTNPNTLGLFEREIVRIAEMVHAKGGLLYNDGANTNALLGLARAGDMGFDILHLNLHKTFSTPHGGGGPGSGPVAPDWPRGRSSQPSVAVPRDSSQPTPPLPNRPRRPAPGASRTSPPLPDP